MPRCLPVPSVSWHHEILGAEVPLWESSGLHQGQAPKASPYEVIQLYLWFDGATNGTAASPAWNDSVPRGRQTLVLNTIPVGSPWDGMQLVHSTDSS